ncbi:ScbA/BarX family gamma-butyrolactone biosynthesis protein [Streptomyces sp. NBC_01506]|uniref:ScbA/BarX family gamma-butyrolactone biosynthesis protein n=1 Tax=Streptomyces sp. NBC_01506 TaxID=2903887 RepID=UPI00386F8173
MPASTCRATTPASPTTTATAAAHPGNDTRTPHKTPAPHHQPPLTTTVPKELVHRASTADVLLTGWQRLDGHRFTLTAQWPRRHSFFTGIDGCHDPLIAAETIRQTGILLAHTELGVPLGHHLLVEQLHVNIQPQHLRLDHTPTGLELHVTCTRIRQRRGILASCRLDIHIHRNGQLAATGGGSFTCISPKVYQRLRPTTALTHDHRTTTPPTTIPASPHTVGRLTPADVVISPLPHPHHWQLHTDTRHPVLFDHPVDHIPGMVLLEAARQATTATLGHPNLPLTITSQFTRYVELDTPCTITTHHTPTPQPHPPTIHITAHQNQTPAFHATITTTPPP